eukprot:g2565.t1
MKVRSAVRRMCRDCYVVKKKRVVYIRCKSVKKHKQRQGFHTHAGVSAWEGGREEPGSHVPGFGACARCEHPQGAAAAASWRAPLPTSSPGVLASLPWLPTWASVPAAAPVVAQSEKTSPALTSPWRTELGTMSSVSAFSPLRALGGWLVSSILSRAGKARPE